MARACSRAGAASCARRRRHIWCQRDCVLLAGCHTESHGEESCGGVGMSGRLSAKRTLITAAGAGIGRESALACAREGAQVVATDIDVKALQSLAAEHAGLQTHALDVT